MHEPVERQAHQVPWKPTRCITSHIQQNVACRKVIIIIITIIITINISPAYLRTREKEPHSKVTKKYQNWSERTSQLGNQQFQELERKDLTTKK